MGTTTGQLQRSRPEKSMPLLLRLSILTRHLAIRTREIEAKKRLFGSQNQADFENPQPTAINGLARFWLYNRN